MALGASAQEKKSFTTLKEIPITSVKNQYESGFYQGIWYMSRDYMSLNTTYIFLNRQALSKGFRKVLKRAGLK
jgi:hypothetical protein